MADAPLSLTVDGATVTAATLRVPPRVVVCAVMEPLAATVYAVARPIRFGFTFRIIGLEHIPEQGSLLLASNHISLFDPLVVAHMGDLRGRRVRFLAMAELFR